MITNGMMPLALLTFSIFWATHLDTDYKLKEKHLNPLHIDFHPLKRASLKKLHS